MIPFMSSMLSTACKIGTRRASYNSKKLRASCWKSLSCNFGGFDTLNTAPVADSFQKYSMPVHFRQGRNGGFIHIGKDIIILICPNYCKANARESNIQEATTSKKG